MSKLIKYKVLKDSKVIKNWELTINKDENVKDKILMSIVQDIEDWKHKDILDELIKSDAYVLNKLSKIITISIEK